MLRKKEVFTTITPIPGFIPRQLAIDILHSHSEVITLNPLVLDHKPIPAPRQAAADEYYSTWYEIVERIQYIPGVGKMGSGKINFNGCFHDTTWGLQTHIYAPMNVDLRNAYRIAGNQPGVEPPSPAEIGLAELGVPSDGLYLREDIEIRCNIAVVGFVKSQLKAASKEMVRRIIKKAELLDAGVLKAMIHDGRLKTINPNDLSAPRRLSSIGSPPGTPYAQPSSPALAYQHTGGYHAVRPGSGPPQQQQQHQQDVAPVEMPGDFTYAKPENYRHNRISTQSAGSRASGQGWDPRTYYTGSVPPSEQGSSPMTTPGMDHKGFAAELAAGPGRYKYNPQDYSNMQN